MSTRLNSQDAATRLDDLRLQSDRRLASLAMWLLLVPGLWFLRADLNTYWSDWPVLLQRLLFRGALVSTPLLGIWLIAESRTRREYSNAVFLVAILTGVVTVAFNVSRTPGTGLPLRTPLLILSIMYFAMPDRPWRQCATPVFVTAGLMVLRLTRLPGGGIDVPGDLIVLASLNAIGIMAVVRRDRLERATSAVVGELKELRGIIPICSHCRKVRSEVNDWQQLERYVRDRSDALFSHGICPECLNEHYKDVLGERTKR